jgi:glycosyltransferase involved in cell wall biosynthesis
LRVSLALATHDGGRFLANLLESITEQTRPPAELVAYDDASSDNSVDILERFASSAPFAARIIRGTSREGSTRAFERALGACTGDLIALCDQDDIWRRDKIERVVAAFERDPELGFVFSDATVIDEEGRSLDRSLWRTLGAQPPACGRDLDFFLRSLVRPTVPGCTAVFSARSLDSALPFPPGLGRGPRTMQHDAWLVAIAGATSVAGVLADPLVAYRVHGDQQIGLRGAAARTTLRSSAGRAVLLTVRSSLLRSELERRATGVRLVSERLANIEGDVLTSACHDAAVHVLDHVQRRLALPPGRRHRARAVLEEWRTGRYRRYSSGALSALADAISRT